MRGARPAKPLPVYSWVEPVDDEMAALCASCTVAVRQRMWSDERRDFEFVTYVWSAGVVFRQDALGVQFREWLRDHDSMIDNLPSGSFKASGTSVNAVVVVIKKRAEA
jgi:hypothetical protein